MPKITDDEYEELKQSEIAYKETIVSLIEQIKEYRGMLENIKPYLTSSVKDAVRQDINELLNKYSWLTQ